MFSSISRMHGCTLITRSIIGRHNIDNMVMRSKVKITDNIFKNAFFRLRCTD